MVDNSSDVNTGNDIVNSKMVEKSFTLNTGNDIVNSKAVEVGASYSEEDVQEEKNAMETEGRTLFMKGKGMLFNCSN
jgi:hypothetical protein